MATYLSTSELAAWWRASALPVLYPIDLSAVAGDGVARPHTTELSLLAEVLAGARVATFAIHAGPDRTLSTSVAVAGDVAGADFAVLLSVLAGDVTIGEVAPTELVGELVATLPELPPAGSDTVELSERQWQSLLPRPGTAADAGGVRERAANLGLAGPLADAVAAGLEPISVGTVGVEVFAAGRAELGPSLVSFQQTAAGAVQTHVRAPRRAGAPTIINIGPYDPVEISRALAEAVSTALFRRA